MNGREKQVENVIKGHGDVNGFPINIASLNINGIGCNLKKDWCRRIFLEKSIHLKLRHPMKADFSFNPYGETTNVNMP